MKKLIFILTISVLLLSCASMGTHQKIYKSDSLSSINKIGIIPKIFSNVPTEEDSIGIIFNNELNKGLEKNSTFRKIILTDSVLNKVSTEIKSDSSMLLESAKILKLDAILYCSLTIKESSYMFIPITDAEVTLYLIDVQDEELILHITFDTKTGKSYFIPPNKKIATKDAVEGAVNNLNKIFSKVKEK